MKCLELFIELNANDDQLDFPVIYASAKNGIAKMNLNDESDNVRCIFETIINTIEPPKCEIEGTMQMLVSNIEYDDYLGRLAVGRIERGTIKTGMKLLYAKTIKQYKGKLQNYSHIKDLKKSRS